MKGKKVLCILCTVILVFGMTGCGEKTDKQLMSYQVFYINSCLLYTSDAADE